MKINLFNNSNRKLNSTVVIDDKVRSMQSVDINGDKCLIFLMESLSNSLHDKMPIVQLFWILKKVTGD